MNFNFGFIERYIADKGFGFISQELTTDFESNIFFHIKTINKYRPDLSIRLQKEFSENSICIWYEIEDTLKGKQVCRVLDPKNIATLPKHKRSHLIENLENKWRNINIDIPEWLEQATIILAGEKYLHTLISERENLHKKRLEEKEKREEERRIQQAIREEEQRKILEEQHAQRKKEEDELQKFLEKTRIEEEIKEIEFQNLVNEIKELEFTHSSQVSAYIIKNRLGFKYKNISGILTMEQNGITWKFKGGFPPRIYAKLCEQLNLRSQRTDAKPIEFSSFKEIQEQRRK